MISNLKIDKDLLKGSLYSFFSFFNQGISFLLLILLAKYIESEEYGMLSMYNTLMVFLSFTIMLSTQGYNSISFFKNENEEEYKKDFTIIIIIGLITTIIIFTLLFFASTMVEKLTKLNYSYIALCIAVSLMSAIQLLQLDCYRINEEIKKYGILSCGFAIGNFALSLILVIGLHLSWSGRVFAQGICTLIAFLVAIFFFKKYRYFNFNISIDRVKKILIWGIPLIPHAASVWIKQGGDRMIINQYYSMSDVGYFSFALNLVAVIIMIGSAFNATNSVSQYKLLSSTNLCDNDKCLELLKKDRKFFFLCLLLSAFVTVFASIVVPLYLANYTKSLPYFWIMSFQGILQCRYFIDCNYLFYFNKTNRLMLITFGSSIIHICLSLILTRYSLYLTCLTHVLSQSITTGLVYFEKRKLFNNLN